MSDHSPLIAFPCIRLIQACDLARELGYAGVNNAFRAFCAKNGIHAVPGRPGWYDPVLVRNRLDSVQGIARADIPKAPPRPLSLVEQRRARNGSL